MNLNWSLIIYFIISNFIAFCIYGIDKNKAKNNKWRVPEKNLLFFSFIGAPYGSYFGMKVFHHKTNKPKFYITVPCMCIIYIIVLFIVICKNVL